MVRIAGFVAGGIPHHIAQRGNRRQLTFFCQDDFREYISLMSEWCFQYAIEVWAYCLMANYVHLVVVPETEDALQKGIGEAHRRYTRRVNFRDGWLCNRFGESVEPDTTVSEIRPQRQKERIIQYGVPRTAANQNPNQLRGMYQKGQNGKGLLQRTSPNPLPSRGHGH